MGEFQVVPQVEEPAADSQLVFPKVDLVRQAADGFRAP